jgi:hypothetical protein
MNKRLKLKNENIKSRSCFSCGAEIKRKTFLKGPLDNHIKIQIPRLRVGKGFREFTEEQKNKIWNNNLFQILCCTCLKTKEIENLEFDIYNTPIYNKLNTKAKIKYFNPEKAHIIPLNEFIKEVNKE